MTDSIRDLIQVQDRYYILASSSRIDDRTRVLKHGETFAVFDRFGDIEPVGSGGFGVYHEGTRFLSRLALSLGHERPLLLSSNVREDNSRLVVDLTNLDFTMEGERVPRGTLHIVRETVLWRGVCYEQLRVANYGAATIALPLEIFVAADFADIFEVRGTVRARRGERQEPVCRRDGLTLQYQGLDGVRRALRLVCDPAPSAVEPGGVRFDLRLEPGTERSFLLAFVCEIGDESPRIESFEAVADQVAIALGPAHPQECEIHTSNPAFNEWLDRSVADLRMMMTDTPAGPYPFAGVPWFSAPFGRDGLITALETLWLRPAIARGVLAFLAATQADRHDELRDAQPGKILHEARRGEMAALGEVPFGRYYGSVDATPLFVVLAGAYLARTGDRDLIRSLWGNVERALAWIDGDGDPDRDGFVEYAGRSPRGLVNQGWKDSHDAVFHADGSPAEPPIALCEVQGYVYAARHAAASMARALGEPARAEALERQAESLRLRFEQAFWCEDLGLYALALDGAKRPCRIRTSNAGQALFGGIAAPERARRVAQALMEPDLRTGWGIRTLGSGQPRYNPMSYHNGSIWPHDNAMIAAGFARYRLSDAALAVLSALFDASQFTDLHRLPELFCGFPRRPGEGPTLYPVACSPQSWSAGAPFMLLEACLGLSIEAAAGRVTFCRPMLPPALDELRISRLRVGEHTVDLKLERHGDDVGINLGPRSGPVEIVVVK